MNLPTRVLDRRKHYKILSNVHSKSTHSSIRWRTYTTGKNREGCSIGEKVLGEGRDASRLGSQRLEGSTKPASTGRGVSSIMAQKHLMDRLPHMPQLQRPTKEELLAAATGFWSRLKVRFKWFSIRSVRPFNADEIGAFFSWILMGHVLWIFLGTTTFFSLAILAVNTVFAQGKQRSRPKQNGSHISQRPSHVGWVITLQNPPGSRWSSSQP